MVLKDVHHVPYIRLNLISTGQLDDRLQGYLPKRHLEILQGKSYCGSCPEAKYSIRDACTIEPERG